MVYGCHPRLPRDMVYPSSAVPPSPEELQVLRHRRYEHVKDLARFRAEANTRALRRIEADALRRDDSYHERGFAVGDLVKRKSERPSKMHPEWDAAMYSNTFITVLDSRATTHRTKHATSGTRPQTCSATLPKPLPNASKKNGWPVVVPVVAVLAVAPHPSYQTASCARPHAKYTTTGY
ncbi:hypothetical protein EXIGLDRAFT_643295 [Exidia glandulosa HHB12029]|uniref:Uncharacterized protein n=1 Tax=Exidia glandulosa HHB12029 TaxID=1314781 RepID=A0A166AYA6_EXIGL|nr:hypothetical protein EXIGLDRAFT_643295 [Exidia glandulosa HHB12029]